MSPFACQKIHFTEYHTEHWFLTNTKASALNNKVSKTNCVSFSNQQANCVHLVTEIVSTFRVPLRNRLGTFPSFCSQLVSSELDVY